ncbi:MAG: DUF2500 family protein [Clostridia bacterium]|nr:DUF2500 family protein [Clostridia bacterium]
MDYVIGILVIGLMGLCYWNLFKKSFAKVKKVKAQLVEKYTYTPVSRSEANPKVYVLVFECEKGKRLSFNVPQFSYGGYKLKKKGTLKYKGDMILEFK